MAMDILTDILEQIQYDIMLCKDIKPTIMLSYDLFILLKKGLNMKTEDGKATLFGCDVEVIFRQLDRKLWWIVGYKGDCNDK